MADYAQMVHDLMQVLSTGESLRPDQPYTSRDPGTKYRSGEVTSDVGLLDPVELLAGLLASKGATLARRAGRALTEPGTRPARSAPPELSESEYQAIRARVAEEFRLKRAAADAEDAAYLARRQQEIDAAMEERFRQYRSPFADQGPAGEARRLEQYEEGLDARLRPYRSPQDAAPDPQAKRTVELGTRRTAPLPETQPSTSQDYADIIRRLFAQGGQ